MCSDTVSVGLSFAALFQLSLALREPILLLSYSLFRLALRNGILLAQYGHLSGESRETEEENRIQENFPKGTGVASIV
jgi:hypothetical protein